MIEQILSPASRMRGLKSLLSLVLFAAFAVASATAQSGNTQEENSAPDAQEAFALACAKAHSRTSLFHSSSKPVYIQAKVTAALGLHGSGQGIYENRWVDAQHWERTIRFPDFSMTELRNDSGRPWMVDNRETLPTRISQMLSLVVFHAPSLSQMNSFKVVESTKTGEEEESLQCYSAQLSPLQDGDARSREWCFDSETGLLKSEELPLSMHVAFGKYISFQGKSEYTHVHATMSGLPVFDMEITYAPLDPKALESLTPSADMTRVLVSEGPPNPEDWKSSSTITRSVAVLPAGTPESLAKEPVSVFFIVGKDGQLQDVSVEKAPTKGMAEAALRAAAQYVFTPAIRDGNAVATSFYSRIWFRDPGAPATETASAPGEHSSPVSIAGHSEPGVYRSDENALTFRYPAGFDLVPEKQLAQDNLDVQRKQAGVTGAAAFACTKLLLSAEKPVPGTSVGESLTLMELDSACIYGELGEKQLKSMAEQGLAQLLKQITKDGSITRTESYKVNGRPFIAVFGAGQLASAQSDTEENLALVLTNIRGRAVYFSLRGPSDSVLQTLSQSTLQIGDGREIPLLPPGLVKGN